MKRWTIAVIASLIVASAAVYLTTGAEAAPKKTMLMGEVVDIVTYTMKNIRGEQMTKEGTFRVENGFPVGILEEGTNDLYIAVFKRSAPASHLQTGNKSLKELVGKQVVLQGRIFKAEGANLIQFSTVSEM